MHELSIALSIVDIAEQEVSSAIGGGSTVAALNGAGVLESITVRIGKLSGVEPEALEFAWEVARQGSRFPAARLDTEIVDARARCRGCGSEFGIDEEGGQCALCGPEASFQIVSGREIEVCRMVLRAADAMDDPARTAGPVSPAIADAEVRKP